MGSKICFFTACHKKKRSCVFLLQVFLSLFLGSFLSPLPRASMRILQPAPVAAPTAPDLQYSFFPDNIADSQVWPDGRPTAVLPTPLLRTTMPTARKKWTERTLNQKKNLLLRSRGGGSSGGAITPLLLLLLFQLGRGAKPPIQSPLSLSPAEQKQHSPG